MCDGLEWNHTVEWGDHISKIVHSHNHISDWATLWDENQSAMDAKLRDNPNMLYPGDVLAIPQPENQQEEEETEAEHDHLASFAPLFLRLRVLNSDLTALANASYKLYCKGMTEISSSKVVDSYSGTTDAKGQIDLKTHAIPDSATDATLTVQLPPPSASASGTLVSTSYCTWKLWIGYLPPIKQYAPDEDCIPGVQLRLHNLGFYEVDEEMAAVTTELSDDVAAAITAFQETYYKDAKGVTGKSDSNFQDKLKLVHDDPDSVQPTY